MLKNLFKFSVAFPLILAGLLMCLNFVDNGFELSQFVFNLSFLLCLISALFSAIYSIKNNVI